jgi:hypothetical protein
MTISVPYKTFKKGDIVIARRSYRNNLVLLTQEVNIFSKIIQKNFMENLYAIV